MNDFGFIGKLLDVAVSLAFSFFVVWYFMRYTEKKDDERKQERMLESERQRERDKEFISIIRESNEVHIKTTLAINELIQKVERIAPK